MTSEFDEGLPLEQEIGLLSKGDQFFSPALRWEEVTEAVNDDRGFTTVTSRFGARTCRWRFRGWVQRPVLPARYTRPESVVRLQNRSWRHGWVAATISRDEEHLQGGETYRIVSAVYGRDEAWSVYRDLDGHVLLAEGLTRAQAVAMVKRVAQERATELGIAIDFKPVKEA